MNKRKILYALAKRYHDDCEAYDKIHCRGVSPRTGLAMPVDNVEFSKINKNAQRVKDDIVAEADRYGITRQEMSKAIREFA